MVLERLLAACGACHRDRASDSNRSHPRPSACSASVRQERTPRRRLARCMHPQSRAHADMGPSRTSAWRRKSMSKVRDSVSRQLAAVSVSVTAHLWSLFTRRIRAPPRSPPVMLAQDVPAQFGRAWSGPRSLALIGDLAELSLTAGRAIERHRRTTLVGDAAMPMRAVFRRPQLRADREDGNRRDGAPPRGTRHCCGPRPGNAPQ